MVEVSGSKFFCARHRPKTYAYVKDRNRLKSLIGEEWDNNVTHRDKIACLSACLDNQAVSPATIHIGRVVTRNRQPDWKSLFDSISHNYPAVSVHLNSIDFDLGSQARFLREFMSKLHISPIQNLERIDDLSLEKFIEHLVILSARYQAYVSLISQDADHHSYENAKKMISTAKKPNGRVNRTTLGKQLGISRWAAARLIKKLKSNGDIIGDI